MDFTYDSEQKALREAVRGLVGKAYADFEKRRQTVAEDPGFDEKLWQRLAEMGILGLPFSEEDGGVGAGPVELGIVAQELGRVLAPEPFLTSVVLAGGLVAAAGSASQKSSLLGALAAGESVLAFAHAEPGSRWQDTASSVTATSSGDTWTLSGVKEPVPHGARADVLVVSAVLDSGETGLFVVTPDASGLSRDGYPDPRRRPRRPGVVLRHPGRAARRRRRRLRGDRADPHHRPHRRVQPGTRRDGGRPRRHHDVPHQPQAVRRHAQHVPGADVPGLGHVRLAGAGPLAGHLGDDGARRRPGFRGRRRPRGRRCR